MKILVFGGRGFLGARLAREIPGAVVAEGVDICSEDSAVAAIRDGSPDAVINAAGKTGRPNVDWCEQNRMATYLANVVGPLVLAAACERYGAHLVHLGSGCVFYGSSPHADGMWRERDHANPISYYSRTKYAADLVLSSLPYAAVIRLRMPVDSEPGPRNLITKLAGYRQVIDVLNSVTVVSDLVRVIEVVARTRARGVFHAVNPGPIRHREILGIYREVVDSAHTCEWIADDELTARGLAVATRSNCVLADERLASIGAVMRPAHEAVREAMVAYASHLRAGR